MPQKKPMAFMSYAHFDDRDGRLTKFCELLSQEVQAQTGEEFLVFQDHKHISWGQNWRERIEESLDEITFLVPILSPSFFKSEACREELGRFLEREKKLKRSDLILPVYYIDCPLLKDEKKLAADDLAREIERRQYADWKALRFKPFDSSEVLTTLAGLATQIRDALQTVSVSGDAVQTGGSAAGKPRASAKSQLPTRVVDQAGGADYTSISDAIEAAQAGDRIMVRPGVYQEGLVIEKPLEIIGDGAPGEVVVEATGKDAVLFKTNMGRVTNLTLRQTGGGNWFGVDIAQGCLTLEGCDITSQSLGCVAIHGGADPRLLRNSIHSGKQGGVFVYENGQGTLEDNEIFGTALAGVEIKTGGNPVLRRNRIYGSDSGGVYVHDGGLGTLEENEIYGNARAGVQIKAGGNPIVRRNRIHAGKQGGFLINENGQGTVEENDVFGNELAGAEITTGGNPVLRRNRIYAGKQGGVYIHDNGQGTLEENEIFGNALAGVEIKTGSNPALRRNRIYDGKQGGVFIWENGQGYLEGNDISGHALTGVEVRAGGAPVLRSNRINRNTYEGVYIHDGGRGVFEDNDLRDNVKGPSDISDDCKPNITWARNLEDSPSQGKQAGA